MNLINRQEYDPDDKQFVNHEQGARHAPFWKKRSNKIITYHVSGSVRSNQSDNYPNRRETNRQKPGSTSYRTLGKDLGAEKIFVRNDSYDAEQIEISQKEKYMINNSNMNGREQVWVDESFKELGQNLTFTPEKELNINDENLIRKKGAAAEMSAKDSAVGLGLSSRLKSPRVQQQVADKMVQIFRDLGVNGRFRLLFLGYFKFSIIN